MARLTQEPCQGLVSTISALIYLHEEFPLTVVQSAASHTDSIRNTLPSLVKPSGGEKIGYPLQYSWVSLVAQLVKNLPAM